MREVLIASVAIIVFVLVGIGIAQRQRRRAAEIIEMNEARREQLRQIAAHHYRVRSATRNAVNAENPQGPTVIETYSERLKRKQ